MTTNTTYFNSDPTKNELNAARKEYDRAQQRLSMLQRMILEERNIEIATALSKSILPMKALLSKMRGEIAHLEQTYREQRAYEREQNKRDNGITLNDVKNVYSGVNGKCCCGCSGTYYAWPDEDEFGRRSPRMVKKVLKIVNESADIEWGGNHAAAVVGKRLYVVYFNDSSKLNGKVS